MRALTGATTLAGVELDAHASALIHAPRRAVWRALLSPDTIPKIMPVAEVIAGFAPGEPFVWVFKLAGRESRVWGHVHRLEHERLLEYEYGDPHSRDVLGVVDVHRVIIELSRAGADTHVAVSQDANRSPAAAAHAAGGWRLALNNLKWLVERGSDGGADGR